MTRGELAFAVKNIVEVRGGRLTRESLCSILDCAVEVGHSEAKGRFEKALGPAVAAIVDIPNGRHEILDMDTHMPLYSETTAVGA